MLRNLQKSIHSKFLSQKTVINKPHSKKPVIMADHPFPRNEHAYKILDQIGGDGVHTTVVTAICAGANSAVVAIKKINLHKARQDFTLQTITRATAGLSHPNILTPHCCFTTADRRLWVVMPFVSGCSLQSLIPKPFPDGLPEPCIAVVLKQLLSALSYLYEKVRTHRGVKPGNILIDSDGLVKLSDLGCSAAFYELPPHPAVAETPYWAYPEVLLSAKSDVWSLGITALELFQGRPTTAHHPVTESLIGKTGRRFHFAHGFHGEIRKRIIWKNGKDVSELFIQIVGECLANTPMERPKPETLLGHPFIKNCTDGPDFLVRNLLQGLPCLEQRFKKPALFDDEIAVRSDLEANSGMKVKWHWKFDKETLLMVADIDIDEVRANAALDGASASTDQMKVLADSLQFVKDGSNYQKGLVREIEEIMGEEERKGVMVKEMMAKIVTDLRVERELKEQLRKELELLEEMLRDED